VINYNLIGQEFSET